MSISDTISKVAATNPIVGVAVAKQATASAILAGLQLKDTATSALLGASSGKALEANQLLASVEPQLGQKVNAVA